VPPFRLSPAGFLGTTRKSLAEFFASPSGEPETDSESSVLKPQLLYSIGGGRAASTATDWYGSQSRFPGRMRPAPAIWPAAPKRVGSVKT
jgi:hypothetical protein